MWKMTNFNAPFALLLMAPLASCSPKAFDPPPTAGTTAGATTEGPGTSDEVTSSTSAATSAGESDPSDTEACSFLNCTDGNSTCRRSTGPYTLRCSRCDVWTQDCPDGEKCTAWADDGGNSWNDTLCVPVGPDKPGEPCTLDGIITSGRDSCELGSMCWHVDPELHGTCVSLCEGSWDAPLCAEGMSCMIANDGALNLCHSGCDPLLQDCEQGWTCVAGQDGGMCILGANLLGGEGDPCEHANACKAGLACVDGAEIPACEGSMCCSPYCDHTLPNTCPGAPEVSCVPWYEPGKAPSGYEPLGSCALP